MIQTTWQNLYVDIYTFPPICIIVCDLRKPDILVHFSNSILLHFYNLHTQM